MFVFIIYLNKIFWPQQNWGEQKNLGELPLNAPRGYTPCYCNCDMKEVRPKNTKRKNNL